MTTGSTGGPGTPSIPNQFPYTFPTAGQAIDFSQFEPIFNISTYGPDFRAPYAENFQLSVEREFPSRIVARLSYVGSLARHNQTVTEGNYDDGCRPRGLPGRAGLQHRRPQPAGVLLSRKHRSATALESSKRALSVRVRPRATTPCRPASSRRRRTALPSSSATPTRTLWTPVRASKTPASARAVSAATTSTSLGSTMATRCMTRVSVSSSLLSTSPRFSMAIPGTRPRTWPSPDGRSVAS